MSPRAAALLLPLLAVLSWSTALSAPAEAGPGESASAAASSLAAARPLPLPPPSETLGFGVADPMTTRLANGLDVVVHPRPGTGVATVQLALAFGEYVDPPGKEGAAEVLLDLLDERAAGDRDRAGMAHLARLGASVVAELDDDTALLTLTAPAASLEEAVALWARLARAPQLDPRDFARVRARHVARAALARTDPRAVARNVLWDTRYGASYIGRHPTPTSLGELTVDDCRALYRAHAGPANAIVLALGDVDPARLGEVLAETLGDWAPQGVQPAPVRLESPTLNGERIYAVDWPGLPDAVVLSVQPLPSPNHPTHAAFDVGIHAFAGAIGSRIDRNLQRLDHLARVVRCEQRHRHGEGFLLCEVDVAVQEAVPTLEQVRSEWFGVLSDEEMLGAVEVAAAREALANHWPVWLAEPGARLEIERAIWRYGLPDDGPAEYIPAVREVDAEEANDALRERLSLERTQWVVVGDLGAMSRKPASTGILVEHRDRDGRPVPD